MRQRLLKVRFLTSTPEFPALPPGTEWHPWDDSQTDEIARVTVEGYRGSRDVDIWPELGDADRCAAWLKSFRARLVPSGTGAIRRGAQTLAAVVTVADAQFPDVTEIFSIAASPAASGLRLGGIMIRISEWAAGQAGVRYVKLHVDGQNSRLVTWYERLGYVTVDEKWAKPRGVPLTRRIVKALRTRLLGGRGEKRG